MNCAEATAIRSGLHRRRARRRRSRIGGAAPGRAAPAAAGRVRLQTRFKAAVRAHLPRPEVPFALRRRRRGGARARSRSRPGAGRLAVDAARWCRRRRLCFCSSRSPGPCGARSRRCWSRRSAAITPRCRWTSSGSDCGSIASWFRGRVDFPVHAPALGGGATCKGGRLVNVGERPAAYIVYRVPTATGSRSWCSIRATRRSSRASGAWSTAARCISAAGPGISTAAYRDRGLGYVVTSDLDEDALTRLVTTSFAR